ncbi:LRRGT00179 [Rattus norvegicus]|uniref:LRRGT00179 n=2 Tax=Rattus norvegicus TaxID=10116 RepID=A0A9K3Y8E8_RAT|nr:LRRGT00179 [Rattus norvegicus]EDM07015.1 LRRGT00179 [Rattus norvegicus]|eukprot:NP_001041435.1 uncharacterized protein LOC501618 [Rattus norvegicus]
MGKLSLRDSTILGKESCAGGKQEIIWLEALKQSTAPPPPPRSPSTFHCKDRSWEKAARKWRLKPGGGWYRVTEANGGVVKTDEWQMVESIWYRPMQDLCMLRHSLSSRDVC